MTKTRKLAMDLVQEGTKKTITGNWIFDFEEIDLEGVNIEELEDELWNCVGVADVVIECEQIDLVFYLANCGLEVEE